MIGEKEIQQLKPNAILVNAGRGGVVDERALKQRLQNGPSLRVIMDVWTKEPNIDAELVALVDQATPHIAGHSAHGKARGTEMAYQCLCAFLKKKVELSLQALPSFQPQSMVADQWCEAVLGVYDPRVDSAELKTLAASTEPLALGFDQLRKNYPVRAEFFERKLSISAFLDQAIVKTLGFL